MTFRIALYPSPYFFSMSDQDVNEVSDTAEVVVESQNPFESSASKVEETTKRIEESTNKKPRTEKQMEVFRRAQEARAQKLMIKKVAAAMPQATQRPAQPENSVDPLKLYADLLDRQNRHIEALFERTLGGKKKRKVVQYESDSEEEDIAPPVAKTTKMEEKKNTSTDNKQVAPKRKPEEQPEEERDIDTFELKPRRDQPKRVATPRHNNMNHMLKLLGY